jgi:hypothetical protein
MGDLYLWLWLGLGLTGSINYLLTWDLLGLLTKQHKSSFSEKHVGLGKNIDSSMQCNLFVLDSISNQNFFEIDLD